MTFDVLCRVWFLWATACVPVVALTKTSSIPHQWITLEGAGSYPGIVALVIFTGYIAVDMCVNRSHRRVASPFLARHRNHVYLLASFCAAVPIFSVARVPYQWAQFSDIFFYAGLSGISALMSVVDGRIKRRGY